MEFLQIIDREAQRLLQIISSILDLVKIEAQEIQLETTRNDLRDLVSEATYSVFPAARDKNVTVHTHNPSEPVIVDCDRERIAQIIQHLLDNAIKFSPDCGKVETSLSVEAGHAALRIRDEGPGVPPEKHATIFGKFHQAGTNLTDKPHGVGVGLALSSGIAKAHNGNLLYEDRDYRGACFILRIPLAIGTREPAKLF